MRGKKGKIRGSKARLARLTEEREQWAAARGGGEFAGTPLRPNIGIERRYSMKLKNLIDKIKKETLREIKRLLRTPEGKQMYSDASFATMAKWSLGKLRTRLQNWASERGQLLVEAWVEDIDANASASLAGSLKQASGGLAIKTNGVNDQINNTIRATIASNVDLIKTITSDYFDQITGSVMRSVQAGGGGADEIYQEIERIGQVSSKRAAFIARDQTSKANTAIENARMQTCGVKKFKWLHSGGGRTQRPLHVAYSGQIFELDNPPIIDERTKERGLPGVLINCRCVMVPVLSFEED